MRLGAVHIAGVGPFDELELSLFEGAEEGDLGATTRGTTVLFGADGTGKTTLLAAIAQTRPGHALPILIPAARAPSDGPPPACVTRWLLGDDDPARPHALVVSGPNVALTGETPEATTARRREQALFDRRAQAEGGFAFVSFSGARWFSRAATVLTSPDRTLLKHDPRATASFDDPTRADLTRETKQVLAYATIAKALSRDAEHERFVALEHATREVVDVLLSPFGVTYAGVDPRTLEPWVRDVDDELVPFDALPRGARHLVSFGALTVRAIAAAYPKATDLRDREIVAMIDDAEAQQEPSVLRELPSLLSRALPRAQWILTTASQALAAACPPASVVALRRELGGVELHEGPLAVIH